MRSAAGLCEAGRRQIPRACCLQRLDSTKPLLRRAETEILQQVTQGHGNTRTGSHSEDVQRLAALGLPPASHSRPARPRQRQPAETSWSDVLGPVRRWAAQELAGSQAGRISCRASLWACCPYGYAAESCRPIMGLGAELRRAWGARGGGRRTWLGSCCRGGLKPDACCSDIGLFIYTGHDGWRVVDQPWMKCRASQQRQAKDHCPATEPSRPRRCSSRMCTAWSPTD
jgi:hypothetical protein